jgi:uncharacterized protein YbjT (DUF2867 family)
MKIAIVLGATGLVGKELVEQLINEPHIGKIIAVTRRPVEYTAEKVVNEVINFENLDAYRDVFVGDMVFSCLGTTVKQAGTIQKQRKVDFDYQYKVAKISSENKVNHYILVSSNAANEKSKNSYLNMKGELEKNVLALPFKHISIIQPSLLKGEREYFRLGETVANWFLPIICQLPYLKRYRPISGSEVAKKMVSVSLSPEREREIFRLDEIFSLRKE